MLLKFRFKPKLSVCSVLRCPDLWLQCSVSFVHGLKNTHHRRIMYFFNHALLRFRLMSDYFTVTFTSYMPLGHWYSRDSLQDI
jgi:hypothetical protein